MKITAAVVPVRSAPFEIETLELVAPLADEAGAFMAANDLWQVREIAVAGIQIGVAHAAGHYPHMSPATGL